MDETSRHWLAGIVEGEGCISYKKKSPVIALGMTDEDIVARVAAIWARPYSPSERENHKTVYTVVIHGQDAINIMLALYPILGQRRRARIRDVLRRAQGASRHYRVTEELEFDVRADARQNVPKKAIARKYHIHIGTVRRILATEQYRKLTYSIPDMVDDTGTRTL